MASVKGGPKRRLLYTAFKWTQKIEEGRVPMVLHLCRQSTQAAQAGPIRMSEDSILDSSTKLKSIHFRRAKDWVYWSAPLDGRAGRAK